MWRANIKNRAFDRMGERFAPLVDPYHFLGKTAFDIKRKPWEPAVNIRHTDTLFEMDVAVPGYKKDEIKIVLENGFLIIKGEKKTKHREEKDDYIMEEFGFNSFERSFHLNDSISHEKVHASYKDGVLHIEIEDVPKEEEKAYQEVAIN